MKAIKRILVMTMLVVLFLAISLPALAAPTRSRPLALGTNARSFSYRSSVETSVCWTSNGGTITLELKDFKCSGGNGMVEIAMYQYLSGWKHVATRTVQVSTSASSRKVSFPGSTAGAPIYFKLYGINGPTVSGSLLPR